MKKIVIDCFSSETNLDTLVKGISLNFDKYSDINYVLIGNKTSIFDTIKKYNLDCSRFEIIDCNERLLDNENPMLILKEKSSCSLSISLDLLKKSGDLIGLLTAGQTGGVLIGSIFKVGLINDLKVPCLTSILKSFNGNDFCLVDCGANVDCNENMLFKFAEINDQFFKSLKHIVDPRIAILNVGKEEKKGNSTLKRLFELLKNSNLNFVGNIEGNDVFLDKADIILCDGVVGNIVLKLSESMAMFFKNMALSYIEYDKEKYIKYVNENFNYSNEGGAILLGVKKPIIKIHGKSGERAVSNSIERLIELDKGKYIESISK